MREAVSSEERFQAERGVVGGDIGGGREGQPFAEEGGAGFEFLPVQEEGAVLHGGQEARRGQTARERRTDAEEVSGGELEQGATVVFARVLGGADAGDAVGQLHGVERQRATGHQTDPGHREQRQRLQ